jgi:MerR family copper efflux transcriptional regulator
MDNMAGLLIGEVAERASVSAPTVRYYEEIGLLRPPARSSSGYRRYSEQTIEELRFIRKGQALWFSLGELGEILRLSRSGTVPCSHVLTLANQHLSAVEERIRQLQRFRDQLATEVTKWNGKETPTCRGLCEIIASAEPSQAADDLVLHLVPRRRGRGTAARSAR